MLFTNLRMDICIALNCIVPEAPILLISGMIINMPESTGTGAFLLKMASDSSNRYKKTLNKSQLFADLRYIVYYRLKVFYFLSRGTVTKSNYFRIVKIVRILLKDCGIE